MKKTILPLLLLFNFFLFQCQEIEKADDSKNRSATLLNAFINTTYKGNTITDFSDYNLDTKSINEYTLILKILKKKNFKVKDTSHSENFKTKKIIDTFANSIIQNVIDNKEIVLNKMGLFNANVYSKNIFKIKNAPKRILGISLGDINGSLNSLRSGVFYQSETYSKINKQKKQLIEHLLAAKTNGSKNEIGFNRASNTFFNIYENTITIGDEIISPIATNAFKYYRYKLEDIYTDGNQTIYKIKVIPKRKKDNVFNGCIYIVADYWQVYKTDLFVDGKQIQQPNVKFITLKQDFTQLQKENIWMLKSQKSEFDFSQHIIHVKGTYLNIYNNYDFNTEPTKTKLVFSVAKDVLSKDTSFWENHRNPKLKKQEIEEYKNKENIYKKRTSKIYLDSLNKKNNGFHFTDLVFSYNYRNFYKRNRIKISFPFNTMFNTVQGWHSKAMFSYFKDREHQNYSLSTILDYGFADHQTRITGHFKYKFNEKNNSIIKLNFGRQITEFNDPYLTAPIFNTITSLLLEENNAKFYDKHFAEIKYKQEITNGIEISTKLSYEKRKPVFNHSKFTLFNWTDADYSSNNPLNPQNFNNGIIEKHDIVKLNIGTTIRFGQKYMQLPNNKINLPTQFPKLNINYTKGISPNQKKHNFDYIEARVFQDFNIKNKGFFSYNIKAGKFLRKKELSFIDYKHFDVTQVHVSIVKDYTTYFGLMHPYKFSVKNKFVELHAEHHFEGYLLQKIPLINKLQFKLIIGANTLLTKDNKPYSELNIGLNNVGFGKYRFLRIDYFRTFNNGNSTGSIVVGLSF